MAVKGKPQLKVARVATLKVARVATLKTMVSLSSNKWPRHNHSNIHASISARVSSVACNKTKKESPYANLRWMLCQCAKKASKT